MTTDTLGNSNAGAAMGRSIPRVEARAKVTGRAEYVHNLRLPGMLYGRIHRSTVAHARITGVDVSAAQAMPGVYAVYTAADIRKLIPEPYFGPAFHDQPILAIDKVRYVGEPVALVLAADPHVADAAAQQIVVEYEELPAVFDEVEAMTSKAVVHEVLKPAGTFPDLKHLKDKRDTNVALDFHLRRGDVQQAFADADHVFEHTFRTQQVLHLPLEPFVTVADPAPNQLVIHTASQSPSFVRIEIARLLGWPEKRVRVKVPYLGGGFGAKLYIKLEALTAAAALIAGRPVKIALTMEEQFYTLTKHATTLRIKSGVTRDGKITARECEVWWNGGAYADIGPRITQKSGFTAAGPYDIDHVTIDSYSLYTNLTPAGALRGFGIPQLVWAYESHTDMIAQRAQDGSAGDPPHEHPARRPAAGDRHADARCRHRTRAGAAGGAHDLGENISTGAAAPCAAAAVSPSVSRPVFRRPRRWRSSTSAPTAVALSIAAPWTWGRDRIPQWHSSPPRRWAYRWSASAWCIRIPTLRHTTWQRWVRARLTTWATR